MNLRIVIPDAYNYVTAESDAEKICDRFFGAYPYRLEFAGAEFVLPPQGDPAPFLVTFDARPLEPA